MWQTAALRVPFGSLSSERAGPWNLLHVGHDERQLSQLTNLASTDDDPPHERKVLSWNGEKPLHLLWDF